MGSDVRYPQHSMRASGERGWTASCILLVGYTLSNKSDNRVLLVEDSRVYQRLISGHLREWGFEVIPLVDGLQAWTLLSRRTVQSSL